MTLRTNVETVLFVNFLSSGLENIQLFFYKEKVNVYQRIGSLGSRITELQNLQLLRTILMFLRMCICTGYLLL